MQIKYRLVRVKGYTQDFTCLGKTINKKPLNPKHRNKFICVDDEQLVLFVKKKDITFLKIFV